MATSRSHKKGSSADHSSSAEEQSSLNQTIGREARAAGDALHGATGQVQSTVAELGADVQQAAFKRAGSLQKRAADSINGFADSVESAGRVFADKQSARAARLLQEGAVALRDLAGSLSEKPIADVVEDVRSYGRAHPAILVGGAMLAGMAFGRLMRSAPAESQSSRNGDQRSSPSSPRSAFNSEPPAGETSGLAGGEL